jgi:hypothetical protein
MNIEKIQDVFSNEAFLQKLFVLETPAEVQAVLKEQGVEMTEEQIMTIRDMLIEFQQGEITLEQLQQAENGEMSEEMLEQVAGGAKAAEYLLLIPVKAFCGAPVAVAALIGLLTDAKW